MQKTSYSIRVPSQRRFLLIKKICLIGIIFFLYSASLSPVAAQDFFDSYLPEEEAFSLFPFSELEALLVQEETVCSIEEASSFIPSGFIPSKEEDPSVTALELPATDDSSGNSEEEALPDDECEEEPEFDIPIVINAKVEKFIEYFQTAIRDKFATWLARSEKYTPFMKNLLKEHGLPQDLVFLAFIESGFDPHAYSRSKASGLWQFISQTGKRYGLKVNWWVDERRDPEKSTLAAAKYLKDLYDRFECWYLAAAGYNAGEYKIVKAMRRYRTEDFWKLTKYRYLKRETKDYVPQMIAAALIAKEPEKYGFTGIEYEEPLRYEKVKVPALTALSLIAKACETSLEQIKTLNPEIRREVTPPNETEYEIKIPIGKKDLFLKNFEALQPLEKFEFKTHRVRSGDTLYRIARYYRVDLKPLLEINHLKKTSRIKKGRILLIPIPKNEKVKPLVMAQKKNGKIRKSKSVK